MTIGRIEMLPCWCCGNAKILMTRLEQAVLDYDKGLISGEGMQDARDAMLGANRRKFEMKVYLARIAEPFEGYEVLGVFSSEKLAEEALAMYRHPGCNYRLDICEFVVGRPAAEILRHAK